MEDLSRKQYTAQSELDQINAALSVFKNAFINSTKEQADEVLQESDNEVDAKVS
jgi:uridine kinase